MTTIFAPITPITKSGIAVIRISGSEVVNCLRALGFKGETQHQKTSFQILRDAKTNEKIDEVLISFFESPQSFTGEDVAEISIHGSPFIAKKIFEILSTQKNTRFAQAGEFSKRAFLNEKIDLVQAEAIPDLIAAETEAQHRQALRQLEGKLGDIYENWRVRLIETSAMIEAAIDFPDEDLPQNIVDNVEKNITYLAAEIRSHLNDNKVGQKIRDGLSLAIIGVPNVGKSSLINFLAQSDVAIVSDIAGTTRDTIEVHLSIAGIPVKIIDTAGIRETENEIEKEGIRRALQKAENADLRIIMIAPGNAGVSPAIISKNETTSEKVDIILRNKIDLEKNAKEEENILNISLTQNINLDKLLKLLEEKVSELIPTNDSALITQERYRNYLKNSLSALEEFLAQDNFQENIELAAEDLRMAAREVGKITGKVDVENILDVIFSRFCIGK